MVETKRVLLVASMSGSSKSLKTDAIVFAQRFLYLFKAHRFSLVASFTTMFYHGSGVLNE